MFLDQDQDTLTKASISKASMGNGPALVLELVVLATTNMQSPGAVGLRKQVVRVKSRCGSES